VIFVKKVALFDIDKTLLQSKHGHRPSFCFAFKNVYGVDVNINEIKHPGFTDKLIFYDILKKHGLTEEEIEKKLDEGIKAMIDHYFREYNKEEVVVYDGVIDVLKFLKEKGVLLGIITGNVEPIAWAKLKKGNIDKFFSFGAFGSDAIQRPDIVKIAIERARKLGFTGSNKDVYVFGDSPRDVLAAKAAGATVIGMATGYSSVDELKEAGADYVFENWKDERILLIFD